jgi:hypothetical protein
MFFFFKKRENKERKRKLSSWDNVSNSLGSRWHLGLGDFVDLKKNPLTI